MHPTAPDSLGLRSELTDALAVLGYDELTPIQAAAVPAILDGHDVMGLAQTGSGKTAAFGLGLLQGLTPERVPQALVLCPTRELADQVADELRRLAQRLPNTRIVSICGGRPFREQRLALEQGSQVVVGTPGRIAEHLRRETLDLGQLAVLVLDEADRMLDMGFVEEVEGIVALCPAQRQTLLFSATFPGPIRALSERVQREAVAVEVDEQVAPATLVEQVLRCEPGERKRLVLRVLAAHRPDAALLFCETRSDCEALAAFLTRRGATALALHGGLEQRERDDVLVQFANGSARLLVATNVAARGLDIPELPAVIVTELSGEPASHLHRVGRTGRAGADGLAVSIVCGAAEARRLEAIEAFLGHALPEGSPPGDDDDVSYLRPAYRTVLLLSGRKQKLRKGDVLGALVKDGKLPADSIGRIDLGDKTCAVAIREAHAKDALRFLQRARVKKQRVRAVLLG